MTDSSHPTLDPAAFEVLRDVASQADSVLLRMPLGQSRAVATWLGRDPISAGAPFLSSAERHLLEVHRDEVAAWMRLAAFQGIFEDPQKAGLMARELDSKRLIELPGASAVASRAADLLCVGDPRYLPAQAQPILRRASAPPSPGPRRPQDPWSLAALSLRLVPHPVPRQWFAARALEASQRQAVKTYLAEHSRDGIGRVVSDHTSRTMLELRGSLAFAEGDWATAASAYRNAATSAVGLRLNALWWGLNAAQVGSADMLRAASELFESHGPLASALRTSAEAAFTLATTNAAWRPTDVCRRLVSKSEGELGGLLQSWFS